MQAEERLTYTIREAALKLGISKNLAYELAKRGQLPGVIRLGVRRVVVSKGQLENLLRGGGKNGDR